MSRPVDLLGLYLHLAQAALRRNQPQPRDRLLVLAGVIAARMGIDTVAAYCRHLVLQHNPKHMVGRWTTLSAALDDTDFLHFLKQLQRRYPLEKAERMLAELGIDMAHEPDVYYTDEEYAASLLGIELEELKAQFG